MFVGLVALAGFGQTTQEDKDNEAKKPKATYQVGSAKVTVWENTDKYGSTWKNFKIEKIYKKGGEWKTTSYFDEKELLELKTALDKAILEESVKIKTPSKDE